MNTIFDSFAIVACFICGLYHLILMVICIKESDEDEKFYGWALINAIVSCGFIATIFNI